MPGTRKKRNGNVIRFHHRRSRIGVLANRLTEDEGTSVLLLEYGGKDDSIFVQMPTALQIPINMPRFNWSFWSQPEPNINDRLVDISRGKGLGGRQRLTA